MDPEAINMDPDQQICMNPDPVPDPDPGRQNYQFDLSGQ